MAVSCPGPSQEMVIHCFRKNKQAKKQTGEAPKTNAPSPRRLIASGPGKKQMPPGKKICREGLIPLVARLHSARRQLFSPGCRPIQAPPRKSCVRATGKTGPEKQTAVARKTNLCLFPVRTTDGKLTIKFTCPNDQYNGRIPIGPFSAKRWGDFWGIP